MSAVRRHCHTIALQTGSPVRLSHTTVVSRWFVMPTAAMSEGETPLFATHSVMAEHCLAYIYTSSCSTKPARG